MTYHLTLGAGRSRLYYSGSRWYRSRSMALPMNEREAAVHLAIACRTHPEAVATEWGR